MFSTSYGSVKDFSREIFGDSLKTGKPVLEMVRGFAPASLQLGLAATLFVLITGIPIGVLSAVKRGTIIDAVGRTFAVFGQALPPFLAWDYAHSDFLS